MTYRVIVLGVLVGLVLATAAMAQFARSTSPEAEARRGDPMDQNQTVTVRVFDTSGELVGPLAMPRVERTEAEWRELLDDEQYRILRKAGTEPAFCGTLLDNKTEGVYACAGCGLPLFSSDTKFVSGSGWPSFYAPVADENVVRHEDTSFGMTRTEIVCARCDGHLGHVFDDGPRPTGERHCLNSASLAFTPSTEITKLGEVETAVFAGGCFWCVEAVFEQLEGVLAVESGYSGGTGLPKYDLVITGTTGHAEAVRIVYDPARISFETLLKVHFETHDPTTLNRQGADRGTQYRSAIFAADDAQAEAARAYIADLESRGVYNDPIVTQIEPLVEFHLAEGYHQDYAAKNPNQGYIRAVAKPKVDKVREKFSDLTKQSSP
ncbi:MAG: bifunctional methionine sulfoxide reductase B/A protein [Phycisphaerales bacterium]